MGYDAEDDLDDLIRVATRLRGRIRESEDRTQQLKAELVRMEGVIAEKVAKLKAGVAGDEVR